MNEALRIVSDYLGDATDGINALLPSIPRYPGDPQPPAVTIVNEVQHNRPARGRLPEIVKDGPIVMIGLESLEGPTEFAADDGYFETGVSIAYGAAGPDAFKITAAGLYTLRAVWWRLRKFRKLDPNQAERFANGVMLLDVRRLSFQPWAQTVDDEVLVGGLLMTVNGRDTTQI